MGPNAEFQSFYVGFPCAKALEERIPHLCCACDGERSNVVLAFNGPKNGALSANVFVLLLTFMEIDPTQKNFMRIKFCWLACKRAGLGLESLVSMPKSISSCGVV